MSTPGGKYYPSDLTNNSYDQHAREQWDAWSQYCEDMGFCWRFDNGGNWQTVPVVNSDTQAYLWGGLQTPYKYWPDICEIMAVDKKVRQIYEFGCISAGVPYQERANIGHWINNIEATQKLFQEAQKWGRLKYVPRQQWPKHDINLLITIVKETFNGDYVDKYTGKLSMDQWRAAVKSQVGHPSNQFRCKNTGHAIWNLLERSDAYGGVNSGVLIKKKHESMRVGGKHYLKRGTSFLVTGDCAVKISGDPVMKVLNKHSVLNKGGKDEQWRYKPGQWGKNSGRLNFTPEYHTPLSAFTANVLWASPVAFYGIVKTASKFNRTFNVIQCFEHYIKTFGLRSKMQKPGKNNNNNNNNSNTLGRNDNNWGRHAKFGTALSWFDNIIQSDDFWANMLPSIDSLNESQDYVRYKIERQRASQQSESINEQNEDIRHKHRRAGRKVKRTHVLMHNKSMYQKHDSNESKESENDPLSVVKSVLKEIKDPADHLNAIMILYDYSFRILWVASHFAHFNQKKNPESSNNNKAMQASCPKNVFEYHYSKVVGFLSAAIVRLWKRHKLNQLIYFELGKILPDNIDAKFEIELPLFGWVGKPIKYDCEIHEMLSWLNIYQRHCHKCVCYDSTCQCNWFEIMNDISIFNWGYYLVGWIVANLRKFYKLPETSVGPTDTTKNDNNNNNKPVKQQSQQLQFFCVNDDYNNNNYNNTTDNTSNNNNNSSMYGSYVDDVISTVYPAPFDDTASVTSTQVGVYATLDYEWNNVPSLKTPEPPMVTPGPAFAAADDAPEDNKASNNDNMNSDTSGK